MCYVAAPRQVSIASVPVRSQVRTHLRTPRHPRRRLCPWPAPPCRRSPAPLVELRPHSAGVLRFVSQGWGLATSRRMGMVLTRSLHRSPARRRRTCRWMRRLEIRFRWVLDRSCRRPRWWQQCTRHVRRHLHTLRLWRCRSSCGTALQKLPPRCRRFPCHARRLQPSRRGRSMVFRRQSKLQQ